MNYWKNPLTIGSRSFGRFIGSPWMVLLMYHSAKRFVCFRHDALLYTEICHCDTIVNAEPAKWGLEVGEPQINFQMSAADETYIERACERVIAHGVTMVDINIGCPAKTVVNKGAGSALMADVPRLRAIIKLFRACLPTTLTVKMRAGFKEHNALDIARMLEDMGLMRFVYIPDCSLKALQVNRIMVLSGRLKKLFQYPCLFLGALQVGQ